MPIPAPLVVEKYKDDMGHVDRVDKNVALSRLRLKRCIRRYHRAIFLWYLATMLNNILVLFDLLFDTSELRQSKQGLGYKHYFQNRLGNSLIKHGMRLAEDEWVSFNATIVKKFMRRMLALQILRTLRRERVRKDKAADARRAQRHRVLGERTNKVGRPKKRKRRGGRKSAAPTVVPTAAATGPVTPRTMTTSHHVTPVLSPASRERIRTLAFVNRTPPFVPKRRGPKCKGKKTIDGMKVGGVTHRFVCSKDLQSRRGMEPVAHRGRCVSCYANAPPPQTGGRKTHNGRGRRITTTTYACDICRKLLCKSCFWNVHGHRQRGVHDFIYLR